MASKGYDKNETVLVSEVLGEGDEAHQVAAVGGWQLHRWAEDRSNEPRIMDLDLAERLGHSRPRDIRRVIRELVKNGHLPGIYVRARGARTSMPRGGRRTSIHDAFWLTEEESLFVASRCKTEVSVAMTKEMIHVYTTVRRHLGAILENQARMQALTTEVQSLRSQFASLKSEMLSRDTQRGTMLAELGVAVARLRTPEPIGRGSGREIRRLIMNIAELELALGIPTPSKRKHDYADDKRKRSAHRNSVEARLRRTIDFPKDTGNSFDNLSSTKHEECLRTLHNLKTELDRSQKRQSADVAFARQQGLFDPKPTDPSN
jgi:hypothetical protein